MKRPTPALTAEAIAAAASKKTAKPQRQLVAAEAELQISSAALQEALPTGAGAKVKVALHHNVAAEEKVHEAAEDLEAVKELLSDGQPEETPAERPARRPRRKQPAAGKSGEGVRSLLPHLRKNAG
jgi:hypothetical protein